MLSSTTAIINTSVVGPIVPFEKNWVVPVVACRIIVFRIRAVVNEVVTEN